MKTCSCIRVVPSCEESMGPRAVWMVGKGDSPCEGIAQLKAVAERWSQCRPGDALKGVATKVRSLYANAEKAAKTAREKSHGGLGKSRRAQKQASCATGIRPKAASSRRTPKLAHGAAGGAYFVPQLAELGARIIFGAAFFVKDHGGTRFRVVRAPVRERKIVGVAGFGEGDPCGR